jgi:hypothetical protein
MRSYLIDANHVTVSREPPLEPREDQIAVASLDELLAARLTGKQLLSLWNGLPGAEKRTRVGDREALVANLWSAIEASPDPETVEQRRSKQADVVAMLRRPRRLRALAETPAGKADLAAPPVVASKPGTRLVREWHGRVHTWPSSITGSTRRAKFIAR